MCDPTLIITGALALASTAASQASARKVAKARNSANSAEFARQQTLSQQQEAAFNQTAAPFTRNRQDAGLDAATVARENSLIGNLRALDPGSIPTAGSAPKVVQDNLAKELNRSLGEGKDFAKRLSRLGAVGENQQQNSFGLLRGAQDQNQLGSFSAGSSNILPLEFNAANRRGDSLATLGSVLGGLSKVGSGISATGGFNSLFPGAQTPPIVGPGGGPLVR